MVQPINATGENQETAAVRGDGASTSENKPLPITVQSARSTENKAGDGPSNLPDQSADQPAEGTMSVAKQQDRHGVVVATITPNSLHAGDSLEAKKAQLGCDCKTADGVGSFCFGSGHCLYGRRLRAEEKAPALKARADELRKELLGRRGEAGFVGSSLHQKPRSAWTPLEVAADEMAQARLWWDRCQATMREEHLALQDCWTRYYAGGSVGPRPDPAEYDAACREEGEARTRFVNARSAYCKVAPLRLIKGGRS